MNPDHFRGASHSATSTGISRSNHVASTPFEVSVETITNEKAFADVFRRDSNVGADAFLLCYECPGDGITESGLLTFRNCFKDSARQFGARVNLFLWDCTSPSFAAARAQLGKHRGTPLLLIVFEGAIADTIQDVSLAEMSAVDLPRVCRRLASFQSSAKPAQVVQATAQRLTTSDSVATGAGSSPRGEGGVPTADGDSQHLFVDVAKMVGMGKKLMAERKPFYAEKFFTKALRTLDAVAPEVEHLVTSREDYDGSTAHCLAWAGLAQLVQGKQVVENAHLQRLHQDAVLRPFCEEPLGDANRALVTWRLMNAAPRPWNEAEDSETKLRAALSANPLDSTARCMLVITLFLRGDLERAMTEALKLHVHQQSFGRVALKQISSFLGSDHVLVKRLGMPGLTTNDLDAAATRG